MKRIGTVGLLAVMALAVCAAFGAASASASPSAFTSTNIETGEADYPSTVRAETESWGYFQVSPSIYSRWSSTGEGFLPSVNDSVSLLTSFTPSGGSISANGCGLTLHTGAEAGPGTFSGTVDIGGAKCTSIAVVTTSPSAPYSCKLSIPAQTGIAATLTNVEGVPNTTELNVEGSMKYQGEGGGPSCPTTSGTGTLIGDWQINATNEAGSAVDFQVAPPSGLYLEGGAFESEGYPTQVFGNQSSAIKFKPTSGGGVTQECSGHFMDELTASSSSLSVFAEYSGCKSTGGFGTKVFMNSCHYVYHAAGTMDVACGSEGDSIENIIYNSNGTTRCKVNIGPQEAVTGLSFTNIGTGNERGVEVSFAVEGLANTVVSGGLLGCGAKNGSYSDGTYTGNIQLYGVG